jgi:hypothetical protein
MCISFGITEFEFGPLIGEPFMDKHINERIDKLSSYDSVKKIILHTNLLNEGPIFRALRRSKVELNVSVYGSNPKVFKEVTGRNEYWLFVKNFRTLIEYVNDNKLHRQIIINKRFNGNFPEPNMKDFNDLSRWLYYGKMMNLKMIDATKKSNSLHVLTGNETKEDICKLSIEKTAVHIRGDISFSGQIDKNKKLVIGNIHKTPLEEIYSIDSIYKKLKNLEEENKIIRGYKK